MSDEAVRQRALELLAEVQKQIGELRHEIAEWRARAIPLSDEPEFDGGCGFTLEQCADAVEKILGK